jgi:putative metallohydrolase (TIGR04338 family)
MLLLNQGSDRYKSQVYAAENAVNGPNREIIRGSIEKPVGPKYPSAEIRAAYESGNIAEGRRLDAQYKADYKTYSSQFDKYVLDFKDKDIQSELGAKYLDGTKEGVQAYVKDVINQSWFTKAYGDGGELGQPTVRVSNAKGYAGQFTSGMSKNSIAISSPYTQDEPTILHEVAHYAQAVSATSFYEAHGVAFAEINLHITDNVLGTEAADQLFASYRANGVPVAKS